MSQFYKFVCDIAAVRNIIKGNIKFTPPEELNDPAELLPIMRRQEVSGSLKILREKGFSEVQFQWLKNQYAILRLLSPETLTLNCPSTIEQANQILRATIFEDLDYMEDQLLRTISLIRTRVGVLSLTQRFDSIPMWAHYAGLAKGYVIRFEGLDTQFAGDATGSLNEVKAVRYVEDVVGMTHDPSTQDDLFFVKLKTGATSRSGALSFPCRVANSTPKATTFGTLIPTALRA